MPTNKQRREAARRHLERQLERRQQDAQKRKQRNLILTIVGTVVIIGALVLVVVLAASGTSKKTPAAAASGSASSSASASASASAAPSPQTSGPCGYTQTGTPAKDVGFPPDPATTPTDNRTLSVVSTQGNFTITLDGAAAPCTVQSIAYLATKGYYNNTPCHRLVDSGIYVLQCGDPSGTGSGGPGYESKDENLSAADYSKVGTVAMANAGPGTDGSQFFIIYKDSSTLPKSYTVIGSVTSGMDVIQKVAAAGVTASASASSSASPTDGQPKLAITLSTVTVTPPIVGSGTMVTPSASASTSDSASSSPAASAATSGSGSVAPSSS